MANNDYNTIKPVGGLQNIGGLTPAKRREERKRKQNLHEQNQEESEQELNKSTEEELNNEIAEDKGEQHSIDYCA